MAVFERTIQARLRQSPQERNVTETLRVLDQEPGQFAFLAWKNVTIVVWTGLPDAAAVRRLANVGEARTREHSVLSDVHLVTGHIGLPDADTRTALVNESRRATGHLAAVGVVLGGSGFWASAIRGFVTSVHVLLSAPFEFKIVSQLDELAQWLPDVHTRRSGVSVSADELRRVLQSAQSLACPSRRAS